MTPEQATTILHFLIPSIEREHATTCKVLAAIPDGKGDYTPDPKSMTAIDLAWHIAGAEQMFLAGAAAGEFPGGDGKRPESIATAAQVIAWYTEQTAINLAAVKAMTGEQCLKIIDFHGVFHAPAIAYLQLMMSHSVHHRGQLSAYLRPMGAKVPSIYGGSADEPIRAASA